MSLLLNQPSQLCLRKPVLVVRASAHTSNGSSSSSLLQIPPCFIAGADPCGAGLGKLKIFYATGEHSSYDHLVKKAPMELVYNDINNPWLASFSEEEGENRDDISDAMVTIGSSHGWVATLKNGTLRLQDDLNPAASDSDPKRISLPPLVTLRHCQTEIVTNVAMSSPSPEEEDCVVAAKFLGPQLSFCRPGQSNSEWTNVRIENPCFFSSRVMFSKKHDMFRITGSGGHLIGSWDLDKHKHTPKLQKLRYQNLPELSKTERQLLSSCTTSEHLVESQSTGETFLLKLYKKTEKIMGGVAKMKTEGLMVFKLDEEGNAVYTKDIGDLCIFISKSEPFCVPASSVPGMIPNRVHILDDNEFSLVKLTDSSIDSIINRFTVPYYISPQKLYK
ncbi:PREDICTED: uncharacterized protein LOC104759528 [Camelina sativa]|uniref:Uncharacterized protein LOC104759528 n=1 Tax=Camelina sativa TaxID=90675 RepID=A0ABM0X4W9_CAMSA|nr:PREDICTED: uncharacterized protein LOC104759528 [Camelina sativa]